MTNFNPRHFQISVANIPAGESATINALLQNTEAIQAGQTTSKVRVIFTYDQQITPQVVEVDLSGPLMLAALTSSDPPQDTQDTTPPEGVSSEPAQSQIQATPSDQTDSQAATLSTPNPPSPAPAESQASVSEQATPEPAPPALSPAQDSSPEATSQPPGVSPLPETGSSLNNTSFIKLSLSVLLALGLGVGGWRSLRSKR